MRVGWVSDGGRMRMGYVRMCVGWGGLVRVGVRFVLGGEVWLGQ